jgi:predicted small lipoprotein YifL
MRRSFLLLMVALLLAACGRKGWPEPVGPREDITYPKTYPTR